MQGTELVVIVADGNSVFRTGVMALLEREPDMRAISCTSAEMLVRQVSEHRPAVALVDVELPPGGGVEAIKLIRRRAPMTELVAITSASSKELVLSLVRAGARGIIERGVHSTSVSRIVRRAAAGEVTLPRRALAYVLDELARTERRFEADAALNLLSHREREVLALVAEGCRNREIADILSISELTVKRHVHNMLHKLGVRTRAAAVSLAINPERRRLPRERYADLAAPTERARDEPPSGGATFASRFDSDSAPLEGIG